MLQRKYEHLYLTFNCEKNQFSLNTEWWLCLLQIFCLSHKFLQAIFTFSHPFIKWLATNRRGFHSAFLHLHNIAYFLLHFVVQNATNKEKHSEAKQPGPSSAQALGDAYMKSLRILIALLRSVNHIFWSHLGCPGWNFTIFSHGWKYSFRCKRKIIKECCHFSNFKGSFASFRGLIQISNKQPGLFQMGVFPTLGTTSTAKQPHSTGEKTKNNIICSSQNWEWGLQSIIILS